MTADGGTRITRNARAGYELGQVFESVERRGSYVIVGDIRDEDHPRGLGRGLPSALALPWPRDEKHPVSYSPEERVAVVMVKAHPFDVVILCRAQEHHGDEHWRLVV